MRALLDVNVLIALHDQDHVYHVKAASWLTHNPAHGWASCLLTQNGCLRIMAQPAYPGAQPLPFLTANAQALNRQHLSHVLEQRHQPAGQHPV